MSGVDIDSFIFQFMSVAAGIEGILIHWLGFVKNLFITGQNVEAVVDILRNILQDSRGMIRLDMDINGLSVGSVSPVLQGY